MALAGYIKERIYRGSALRFRPDSAALRTAASISCRIRPLNGLISIQYARNRRLVATSGHNTRVSVLSSVAPSARIPTSKFHAALAVPEGAGARNRFGLIADSS